MDRKVSTNLTVPETNARRNKMGMHKMCGILVPEETDCSGITSIKKSFLSLSQSRRRDRQEKRTRKTTERRPPGHQVMKEKEDLEEKVSNWNSHISSHIRPILRLEEEEVEVEKSGYALPQTTPQAVFQDLDLPPG
ncbi:hypothetical protein T12_13650 [Trichinella patagoniensis]|uniref:Uncharacterized protein n=1 Tax=Trichinella patagoniensis TaxID=990121 RepID=A0A0V0ZZU4_9BILA|nr:hypothetical protein T12_13650 [Trichinella patagoniensis]